MRVPQRGRAILRRLSPSEAVRTYRPGDFLLTRSTGALALLHDVATGGEVNHAALIVDPTGAVIEANPMLLADPRAYRLSSVSAYLRAGEPCWIAHVELREGTRQDVADYAEHLLQVRGLASVTGRLSMVLHTIFGILPRARTARIAWLRPLHTLLDRHALVLREEHCYASAELVARALERGGFIWDRDPASVTPRDLFERYHLAELSSIVTTTPTTPTPLRMRRSSAAPARAVNTGRPATITPFASRGQRQARRTAGATALLERPQAYETPQAGLQALLHIGVLTAASLAIIGVIEECIHLIGADA